MVKSYGFKPKEPDVVEVVDLEAEKQTFAEIAVTIPKPVLEKVVYGTEED